MTPRRRKSDNADIPAVIPKVEWVDGEPVIAREQVVKPSPVPRSLAIIVILLAAFSVGYTVYQQEQRGDDREAQRIADEADDRRVEGLVEDLQKQQERSEVERERLRLLIIGLLAADTPEEREALLRQFAEETAAENRENAAQDRADPMGQPSTNDEGVTEPQSQPSPSESSGPDPPDEEPDPEPSPSEPPPIVDVPPPPVPLPPPVGGCINTPLGKVCT